ncbi:MAG: hypothetical protein HY289_00615 [Planctomycetes bacterium]|nr:hypothetical protein [Planctomycetota bacterium]
MLRSVVAIIIVAVSQLGCCCCTDFMKGFNKGFKEGVNRGRQQANDDGERAKQDDDARRKADLDQLIAKNLGPNKFAGALAPTSAYWADLKKTIDQRQYVTNKASSNRVDTRPFSDTYPQGGVLIGFFAGEGDQQVVVFLQPIYLTKQGEKVGRAFGRPGKQVQCLKAKAGYAVGGATMRQGAILDAITVTFMRVDGDRLNPADRYDSMQVGGDGGGPMPFMSAGPFLVGIHGKQNENDNHSPAESPNCLGFYSLP